jgi:type I restriction enzyme S subunit
MNELPNGWAKSHIGDFAVVDSGVGFPKDIQGNTDGDYPVYKVGDVSRAVIEQRGIIYTAHNYVSKSEAAELKGKIFECGTTLFAKIGEALRLNRRALVEREGLADNNVMGVKPVLSDMDRFVHYFLRNTDIAALSRSTTVPSVRKSDVEGIAVPLPPLNEQKRIADKLDRLLARVDAAKARLDKIPALLKRLRQAILTAATTGKLTEEWREENGIKQSVWSNTTFGRISEEITVGFVGKMSNKYRDAGIPFLRSQNVRAFRFSPENLLYISEEFHHQIYKSRLTPGDLAIVRSGAPGTTCVIPDELPMANCSDLVIVRPGKDLDPHFGAIYMNSEVAQKHVETNRVGVAQQHFNVGSMKEMGIQLPLLLEQKEIVRRVEELFAIADRIEAQYRAARTRVDRLMQSLLAKAFRGELVPQDPNDEPATILLERIRAQRAAAPKLKRGQYRKAAIQELPMVAEEQGNYTRKMSRRSQSGKKSK